MIDRLHQTLGIRHADVTASSPRRWRITVVQQLHGDRAAAEVAGEHIDRLPLITRRVAPPAPLTALKTRSFLA